MSARAVRVVTDQMGRAVQVPRRPERIVSLVPSQTELLFDLGLDAEIVGVTRFCVRPADQVRSKHIVGGTQRVGPQVIDRLRPDLIIANKEENDRNTVLRLAESYPVWVSDIAKLSDALQMIRAVGDLVRKGALANDLAADIEVGFAGLSPASPSPRVAYVIWQHPLMVAGQATFIDDMLTTCGFTNAFATRGDTRYPAVTLDGLCAADLDAVLLSSEPCPFEMRHRDAMADRLPGVAVHLVDGEMFSWYGSRLLPAIDYFGRLIESLAAPG